MQNTSVADSLEEDEVEVHRASADDCEPELAAAPDHLGAAGASCCREREVYLREVAAGRELDGVAGRKTAIDLQT